MACYRRVEILLQPCVGDWGVVLVQFMLVVDFASTGAERCDEWKFFAESFQPTLAHKDIAQA